MTRRSFVFLFGGLAAAQIVKPRVGYIVDRQGCLRGVDGLAGAFTISEVLQHDVVSAAFSGRVLVVKHPNQIRIGDQQLEAPTGPATVVFDGKGNATEIFFAEAGVLWTWNGDTYTATPAHDVICDAYIREGELIVNGIPVRMANEATQVSQLGEGWLVVYTAKTTYAVRGEQVFELPEVDEQ
jgi:hypothetical protein